MKRVFLPFIITLLLGITQINAQSVGVVLSGGGAKGLYHIGVIEALEDNGVPIDYIGGTSIGAIVAGLYASGYTTEEMRELATSGKLERWVSGKIDNSHSPYFRRGSTISPQESALTYHFNITSDSNDKADSTARIPRSIISTTQIDMALSELFTPASIASKNDFSRLMIPFFCCASDITANCGVTLKSGDLGRAIRASMALPLAFKPIIDAQGHILYDGGIYDNFPWRVMNQEHNPDIIIGAVCGVDSWANSSNLNLVDQAFLLAMNPTNYDLPEGNIAIKRDVPIGMLEFDRSEEVIAMGYFDTVQKIDSILVKINPSTLKNEEYYEGRRTKFRAKRPDLIFDSYTASGLDKYTEEYLHKYVSSQKREERKNTNNQRVMNFTELRNNLYSVLASNEFATNYPSINYDSISRRYKFEMDMEHRSTFKVSINGNLSSTPFNQIYASVNYTAINRVANRVFGELYLGPLYTTGRLGYRADFYANTPMFADAYFSFSMKNLNHGNFGNITNVNNAIEVKSNDYFLSIGVGAPIKSKARMLLRCNSGAESFKYNYSIPTDLSLLNVWGMFDRTRIAYFASKLEFERSTINNFNFPTKGSILTLSTIAVAGQEKSYSVLSTSTGQTYDNIHKNSRAWVGGKLNYSKYYNPTTQEYFTFGISCEAVYTTLPDIYTATARQIMMPAYQPIAHTQMTYMPEYSAPRYAAVGAMPSVKLWRELYMQGGFYAMLSSKYNSTLEITSDSGYSMHYITQAALAYNTTIGPMSLALTKYDLSSWSNLYLTFNFGITIFSPRGTFY